MAVPAPPAEPRPLQPINAADTGADARLRAQMAGLLAGCRVSGYVECARLGAHYLDATGTPLTVPVDALLSDMPAVRAELAARLATGVTTRQAFDTGWLPAASPAGTDWAYALGHFSVRLIGAPDGRHRVFVADVYDFDVGRPFAALRTLADDGVAAEFLVTGASATMQGQLVSGVD